MSSMGGILDVAVGMTFIYLLLSLICSGANELVAWIAGRRAATLRSGIETLLRDPALDGLADNVYAHPLVTSLSSKGKPSYIPSSSFVLALVDTLRDHAVDPAALREALPSRQLESLDDVRTVVQALPDESRVRRQLELLLSTGVADLAAFQQRAAAWFDGAMARLTGVYKRRSQAFSIAIGLFLAFAGGVDTLTVGDALMHDGTLRQATVAAAVEYAKRPLSQPGEAPDAEAAVNRMVKAVGSLEPLKLPVGYPYLASIAPAQDAWKFWAWRVLGMIFTGLAISFGAPFWFDMLNRLINLRTSGPPPTRSGGEGR
jgi:hypothetical protein